MLPLVARCNLTTPLASVYLAALASMDIIGQPADLHGMASDYAKRLNLTFPVTDETFCQQLLSGDANDPLRGALRMSTARWDASADPGWAEGTQPNTPERRAVINRLLKLSDGTAALLDEKCPISAIEQPTVIAREWTPWYTGSTRAERAYYWSHYDQHLEGRGWSADSRAALDIATDRVVERLTNPTQMEAYQAKGLVVGHVQSGKTAHFTGVVAKAIDAGYRLVIVLSGTTDILRAQTQRRLDMELVGRENILRGAEENDPAATEGLDYQQDPDWIADRFVRHGCFPRDAGRPAVHRLTGYSFDYKSLRAGIVALDFPKTDSGQPFYSPANLFPSDARLAIVKKNASVLRRLVEDLKKSAGRMEDVPVLLIDDESDQASPNTSNPKSWVAEQKQRTAINRWISQLLRMLPRGQYVGYTATPFANVFIDPSDVEDIFPNDFLVSLPPDPGYMGPSNFYDLDRGFDEEERTFANSNEMAHLRVIPRDPQSEDEDVLEALDAFVLTGAIKLYREARGDASFRHHTMLVHEHMRKVVHGERANRIRSLWTTAGYYSPSVHSRLRELYECDLLPVMLARAEGDGVPADYATLKPHIGEAVGLIGGTGNPVLVVNSDKIEGEALDFDHQRVWRVLVGGNKLARGFTVEGLTISYYRRDTQQGDTLMQMGRWFGYRHGYRDLVRLYTTKELNDSFRAICRDEEFFRTELARYAEFVDGKPQVTPAQVPPLVAQHAPWLKPTSPSKMYNAVLTERRSPGVAIQPIAYPEQKDGQDLAWNVERFMPLIQRAISSRVEFRSSERTSYEANIGTVTHEQLLDVLSSLRWHDDQNFTPDLNWLAGLGPDRISDWAAILPQEKDAQKARRILSLGPLSLFERGRRRPPYFGEITDPKHRAAANCIAGIENRFGDTQAAQYSQSRRGAMLIYPVIESPLPPGEPSAEMDPRRLVMAFWLLAPQDAQHPAERLVKFVARDSRRNSAAIVELATS